MDQLAPQPGAARTLLEFERLFDASPNPYLVLDRTLHIATADKAYLASVKRELPDLVGRWAWDAFPTDPDTERQAIASFERVIATKQPDVMALLRFDTPRPLSKGGGFDEHYWTITHTPILDDTGEVAFVLQHPIEVTELKQLRDAAAAAGLPAVPELHPAQSGIFDRAQQVHEANRLLKAERERLALMFQQAPSFMAMLRGADHVFEFANPAYLRLIGHREVVGRPVRDALPEAASQGYLEQLDRVYTSGEAMVFERARFACQLEPDGPLIERFVDSVFQPVWGPEGQVNGIFVEGTDITERVLAEEQQALLTAELSHRMKNMLAMVQAVTTQTLRHVSDRDAVETLTQRLHALSDANEVLQQENWAAASLTEVVTKALAVFGRPERFKVEGPAVELGPRATLSLSLLLHELGTNAVKYGALSVAEGRVAVSWQVKVDENEPVLALCWQESGGPHVPAPTSRGFGSRLIQLGLVGTGGTVVTYSPEGLAAEMRAPLSQLQDS